MTMSGIDPHWHYFLALDSDLARLARYVEFHADNFACFSFEMARILLAACAEVDVVGKQLCTELRPGTPAENIVQYRDIIRPAFPKLAEFSVVAPRFGLSLVPWDAWKKPDGVPPWWTAHNKVKHERHTSFGLACLKHALHAVAGLLVFVLYLYRQDANDGMLAPDPEILRAGNEHIQGMTVGTPDGGIWYQVG
jgi:hypothetical protein